MEMNGFRELTNVTTQGRWMSFDDFESVVRFVLAGSYKKAIDIKNFSEVITEMIAVGFLETSEYGDFIRVKKEWYGK